MDGEKKTDCWQETVSNFFMLQEKVETRIISTTQHPNTTQEISRLADEQHKAMEKQEHSLRQALQKLKNKKTEGMPKSYPLREAYHEDRQPPRKEQQPPEEGGLPTRQTAPEEGSQLYPQPSLKRHIVPMQTRSEVTRSPRPPLQKGTCITGHILRIDRKGVQDNRGPRSSRSDHHHQEPRSDHHDHEGTTKTLPDPPAHSHTQTLSLLCHTHTPLLNLHLTLPVVWHLQVKHLEHHLMSKNTLPLDVELAKVESYM